MQNYSKYQSPSALVQGDLAFLPNRGEIFRNTETILKAYVARFVADYVFAGNVKVLYISSLVITAKSVEQVHA